MQPPVQDTDTQSVKPCPQCGTGVKFRLDPTSQRKSCPHCGYVLPNQIGHFKLAQIIGTGGMGAVYRGLDTSLERQVAVKVMREEFARNPQFVESFLREARAAASLNHPNVAQIYSFGEQNSRYYLVMELLPNGSLDDRIEKEHRLPEVEVLDIGIQVAGGLRAAYERGLIHRDIKPGNILFGQDGTSKVVDFGLARFESKGAASTQEEGIWGTPYYIAPEKVSDNLEDFRSDIYSLGGTLFHALAGRAPFEAGTSTEVVLKHLRAPAVSLKTFSPDTTPQTAEVIGRMLKRDPAERQQSYDELLNDLAYAKRFALEKKPPAAVEKEEDFPIGMLVGTLAMIVICLIVALWLWFHREKYFGTGKTVPTVAVVPPTNTTAAVKPPPPVIPVKPPPVEDTPPDYEEQIEHAHGTAANGSAGIAVSEFDHIRLSLPANHPLDPWLKLHTARALWMSGPGRESEAITSLTAHLDSTTAESLASGVSTNQYPQLLELILIGKISGSALDKNLTGLPDWMKAMAHFDAGLSALHQNRPSETLRLWQHYAQMEVSKDVSWPYAYQPMVRNFEREYADFKEIEKKTSEMQGAGKFLEIQDLLEKSQDQWRTPVIQEMVKAIGDKNRELAAKQQKEKEEKERKAQEEFAKEETRLLDEVRKKKSQFMATYRFDLLLKEWQTLDPKIKTDANRKILAYHTGVAQCLADMKDRFALDVAAIPYDQGKLTKRNNAPLPGKLVQIKEEKLVFKLDLGNGLSGETACQWADLLPSAMYALSDFYAQKSREAKEPNNSNIAHRDIALALFAREYGLQPNLVSKNLSEADQTGADVKELIKLLFPDPAIK